MSLRRELGSTSSLLITVGAMIGSGVFFTPHDVAERVGSSSLTLALWVAGGVLALLGALSHAELGAAIPEAGGLYVYLQRAFGPLPAFVFGWAMLAVLVPSSVGVFAQYSARNVVAVFGLAPSRETPIALAMIALIAAVNVRNVRGGAALQDGATVLKFAGLVLLALFGFLARPAASVHTARATQGGLSVLASLVPVLWAYDGWIDVTSIAGEVREPERNIPRSLVLGTLVVTAIYLVANVAFLRVLGPAGLAASGTPALDVAQQALGAKGRAATGLLIGVSTFGGCAVALLTGSRVVYAVARDGLFFAPFGRTTKGGAPGNAVLACAGLAVLYVTSRLGRLGDVFVIGAWPFYAAGALATLRLRSREPSLLRPYRTPGHPYTLVVFAAASLAVVAGYAVTEYARTAKSLGIIALGAPLYFVARWRSRRA